MNMDFEQFLMEKFNETVVNTENDPGKDSDRFHDMFCDWLEMLPRENLIEMGDQFAEYKVKVANSRMINGLNACPFCGEFEAKFEHFDVVTDGEVGEFCGVRCQHCGINFFTDGKESSMINDWNTRKSAVTTANV